MEKHYSYSQKATHDLFIYDQNTDALRHRLPGDILGEEVEPVGHDVYGDALVAIGNVEIPICVVVERLKALDPEELVKYPDKTWGYFTNDDIPDQTRMKELFDYDAENGVLVHKLPRHGVVVGTVAGSEPVSPNKSIDIIIEGFRTKVQSAVYLWHSGVYHSGVDVRHLDGDKTNNRIENLYTKSL